MSMSNDNKTRSVGLIVDSTFGVDKEYAKENNIKIIPLQVLIDEDEYTDGLFDPDLAIKALEEGKIIKTSQPSPEVFMETFEEMLKQYDEVICMTLSQNLSGTFNAATLAQKTFNNENVYVVDSESTISGGVYYSEKLIDFLNDNKSAKEALDYLEQLKDKGSLIFTVDNLQTLVRNGRLGKISGFIGNMLKIKPILRFRRGILEVEHKVRSRLNAALYLVDEIKKMTEVGKVDVLINYVDQKEGAEALLNRIKEIGKNVSVRLVGLVSPVISAHIGLGGLGIYLTNV